MVEFIRASDIVEAHGGILGFMQEWHRVQQERAEMVARLLALPRQRLTAGNQWVYEDGFVSPRDPRHSHYSIAVAMFDTPERLEHWLLHLAEKDWVTESLLTDLLAWVTT